MYKRQVSINIDESDFSTFENAGFNIKNNDILEIMKAIFAVTGHPVSQESSWREKSAAAAAFEKAWDFGFTWNISTYHEIFGDTYTKMGHAVYAAGGTDFNMEISCPFSDEEQVYQLDLFELYGVLNQQTQKKVYCGFTVASIPNHF